MQSASHIISFKIQVLKYIKVKNDKKKLFLSQINILPLAKSFLKHLA